VGHLLVPAFSNMQGYFLVYVEMLLRIQLAD